MKSDQRRATRSPRSTILYTAITARQRRITKAAPRGVWERSIYPDDVLLFRYSALTFNGHRIHYDRRYATEVEKYPGLVVHGPLIATLLLDLLAVDARGEPCPVRIPRREPFVRYGPFFGVWTAGGRRETRAAVGAGFDRRLGDGGFR